MADRYLLPTLYGKYPYFGRTADADDNAQTKYGGHEGDFLTLTARAIAPGRIRVSWTSPPTQFTQFQLRRGSLTYPDVESEGVLLKDEFVGGGTIEDQVPELTNAYYAFLGLNEATATWITVGRAWCLSVKDTGSVEALVNALPRTYFTGGAVYDPLDRDGVLYRFLDGLGFMFDLLKSESMVIYDYPHNTSERSLLHVLSAIGDEPVGVSPLSNRRLISVMRHAQQRKGTAESVEEIASALTGYDCKIRRDLITDAPILDNMVLTLNDSSPYDLEQACSVTVTSGTLDRTSVVPVLAPPYGGTVHTEWAWRITSSGSAVFGTDTGDEPLAVQELHQLIPVNPQHRLTLSAHYKWQGTAGTLGLVLRYYDRDGELIPIFEIDEGEPPPEYLPSGDEPDNPPATEWTGDTVFSDVPLDTEEADAKTVGPTDGWKRIYGTAISPVGAVYASWHITVSAGTVDVMGIQLNRGFITDYADPRTVAVAMSPSRINLAPTGSGADPYGYYTDGTITLLQEGHHSLESLQITPATDSTVSLQYPREADEFLLDDSIGWRTVGLSIKTSVPADVVVAWVQVDPEALDAPFDTSYGYSFDSGAGSIGSMTVQATEEWQKVTVSAYFQRIGPEVSQVLYLACESPNVDVFIDNLIIEPESLVGSFFDGNYENGTWFGEPYRSSSGYYPEWTSRTKVADHYLNEFVASPVPYRLSALDDPDYIDPDKPENPIADDSRVIADDPRISSSGE